MIRSVWWDWTCPEMVAGNTNELTLRKKPGCVGDLIYWFWIIARLEAPATGLGEDLMKGAISYEIVRLMKEGLRARVRKL